MLNQSCEDIINDQCWNNGYDAHKRKTDKAKNKIIWVLNTLLSAGTDEKDECIIELKQAIKILS